MDNNTPGKSKARLVIYLIFFISLFILIVSLIYYFLPDIKNKLVKTPDKDPTEYKEVFKTEIDILLDYYSKNNMEYPAEYNTSASPYYQALALRPKVVEREVSWKNGVLFSISSTINKEEAISRLTEYRNMVVEGGDPKKIVTQLNNDDFARRLNPNEQDQSYIFNRATRDRNIFLDKNLTELFFNSPEGTVSEIVTDEVTNDSVFFVITKTSDGQYPRYQDWLSAASGGKVTEIPNKFDKK